MNVEETTATALEETTAPTEIIIRNAGGRRRRKRNKNRARNYKLILPKIDARVDKNPIWSWTPTDVYYSSKYI